MCDEAVYDSLAALKVIPDWFLTFYCFVCRRKYTLFS